MLETLHSVDRNMYKLLVGHGTCFRIEIECEPVVPIEDSATLWWFSNYERNLLNYLD